MLKELFLDILHYS